MNRAEVGFVAVLVVAMTTSSCGPGNVPSYGDVQDVTIVNQSGHVIWLAVEDDLLSVQHPKRRTEPVGPKTSRQVAIADSETVEVGGVLTNAYTNDFEHRTYTLYIGGVQKHGSGDHVNARIDGYLAKEEVVVRAGAWMMVISPSGDDFAVTLEPRDE